MDVYQVGADGTAYLKTVLITKKKNDMNKNRILNNGKVNYYELESDAIATIEMHKDSILYVDLKALQNIEGSSVEKQIWLSDLIKDYKGPPIYIDFDKNGTILGVEIT